MPIYETLKRCFKTSSNRAAIKSQHSRRAFARSLRMEALEERRLMAGDVSISISDTTATEGSAAMAYLGNLDSGSGALYNPAMMTYGPDGHLYIATSIESSNPSGSQRFGVLRIDATTGAALPAPGKMGAEFVSPGAGGLNDIRSVAFGPDGNLYVVSELTSSVLRFDRVTGEPAGVSGQTGDADFIATGVGGIDHPRGLLFHTDDYLYVTSCGGDSGPGLDSVLRYDATTGAPAGISGQPDDAVFISSGSGGLDNPSTIVFENGKFYVPSTRPTTSNSVLEYSVDGAFIRAFVPTGSGGLAGPADIIFRDGNLFVSSFSNDKVLRYNGITGAFVDEVASGGGLDVPLALLFDSKGNLLVSSRDSDEIRRYGSASQAAFSVSLSSPSTTMVTVAYATTYGTATSSDFTTASGTITFAPGQTSRTILVQTVDDGLTEVNESFFFNLSNPVGATIADGQGVGTIIDNDPFTKFYVVNDASTNRTYEYGANGSAIENYALNSGNATPTGAASTIAGDKVWVVDANKNVYVYNTSGGIIGSWSARSLASNATVQGIATNGTDVWIVDSKSDKVFKYTGAASRLSGSQNAASSFNLNSSNSNATDIVVGGSSLWVTNDSSTNKVFKYSLTGSLQGSWTIDAANSTPTGITVDPSNVSNIWIVDSGTDKIYQYNAAATRTSGSQSAAAVYSLAAGNTNPQGIADPPPSDGTPALAGPVKESAISGPVAFPNTKMADGTTTANLGSTGDSSNGNAPTSRKVTTDRNAEPTVQKAIAAISSPSQSVPKTGSRSKLSDEVFSEWNSDELDLFELSI